MELKASIDEGKDTQNPAYSEGDHEDSSGPPEGRKKEAINNDVGITELTTQEPDDHAGHQELRDSTSSPRKKRSRDQFDADADREQKIMATEEARAHRRSAEIDRVGDPDSTGTKVVLSEAHTDAQLTPRPTYEALRSPSVDAERTMQPPSTFGKTSAFSPSATSSPTNRPSSPEATPADQLTQTSATAFASSGFAALSVSSTSPFGTLASSSTATSSSPFAIFGSRKDASDDVLGDKTKPAANGGFGTFSRIPSTGFSNTEPSPFGASGTSNSSVFSGTVFSGGFGGAFGGGSKLTSFAAPTGDAKLGVSNGVSKPIGSSANDDDEDEDSESDDETFADNGKDEDGEETDSKFQLQDVETGEDGEQSIFSARASLYSFKDNAWKEGGKGIFKFNVATSNPEEADSNQKTGRFIMRAHQTYRVLLNAPVLKQMKIGDSRGHEPSGKSFSFAVIEYGKPVPHMVKLGDVTESKALYHAVQRLQESLI